MVAALLALILWNGVGVFWPKPIVEFTLRDASGQTSRVAGEIVQSREVRPQDPTQAPKREIQLFTGNKDAYGLAFRFLDAREIVSQEMPPTLLVAERMEYGDAIFHPVTLRLADGREIPAEAAGFEAELRKVVAAGNRLREEIRHLEKGKIGAINRRIQVAETRIREAERRGGAGAGTKIESLRARIAREQAGFDVLVAEARALREQLGAATLVYRLSSGEERTQSTGDLVQFYAPNRLGWAGQAAVFLRHGWEFVTGEPREANTEGGIFPAIFGTFVMTLLLAVLVTPFGVIAAIYLREYAAQGLLVRVVRICVNNLAGVPSIVFGVFGLGFFVYGMGAFLDGGAEHPLAPPWWYLSGVGFILATAASVFLAMRDPSSPARRPGSGGAWRFLQPACGIAAVGLGILTLFRCPYFEGFFHAELPTPTFGTGGILWASLTLALMTLPVVIVATEEALAAVPRGVREAALACGASKWQMIQRVVLPSALPGVMTGVILAMARGAGEVAPLMITGVVKLAPSLPLDLDPPFIHAERKFMHLGFHIYDLGFQSPDSEGAKPMVFATTLFLILLVVVLNLAAIQLRAHLRRKYQAGAF
jgi:ABC-type phosphate transport system permease subunit